ncbi:hypothetical protein KY363_02315 [Candidatus Woesearchaeota archaeon]|nr:hypothetical protein [Candidatus Woesearchaeota archaeon]
MSDKRKSIDKLVQHVADSMYIAVLDSQYDYATYTKVTGMEPESGEAEVDHKNRRRKLLTPGMYSAEINAPDIEAITANDAGSGAARDRLADNVEHNIVMSNLALRNGLAQVHEYIELPRARTDFKIYDSDYLNGNGVAVFRNLFIQFEKQLVHKLSNAPIRITPGERISVTYSIDDDGDLEIAGVGTMAHSFTFDVPPLVSDEARSRLMSDIESVVQKNLVNGYILTPKHPFYSYIRFGENINPTIFDDGRKAIASLAMGITKQIAGRIVEDPAAVNGGKFRVSCDKVGIEGLVNADIRPVLLSQSTFGTVMETPNVEGASKEERDMMYETYACGKAIQVLLEVLGREYSNYDMVRFGEALALAKESYYKETDDIGVISDAWKKQKLNLSENEALHLDSLYNSTVDSILETMYDADQDVSVPVYVELAVKRQLDDDGAQRIELLRSKIKFLEPDPEPEEGEPPVLHPVYVQLPAIEEGKLTREEIYRNARELVDQVSVYVFGSAMEQSGHPLKERCFEEYEGRVRLSEEGAEILGSQIQDVSDRLGRAVLSARAGFSPQHFKGMDITFFYGVDDSCSFCLDENVSVTYKDRQDEDKEQ